MELNLAPDVQAKLDQFAHATGRPPEEVVADALAGYYDEIAAAREMLERRYEEMKSGDVEGIDGEEAYRILMERTEAQRRRKPA